MTGHEVHGEARGSGDDPDARDTVPGPGAPSGLSGSVLGGGGLAKAVRAGTGGEDVSAAGVFSAIGGLRGIFEAVVPSLLFLLLFIPTQDARISALVPGVLAVILVIVRLVQREAIVSALSGVLGVGIAVLITLITGRGVDYFLSGFIINIAWSLGLLVTIFIGRPAIGLLIGVIEGDAKRWRQVPRVRRMANWLTVMWLALFLLRLAVQLPLYLSEQVGALGVARIAMGVPLFAVIIVVTWFGIRRVRQSSDDSGDENGVISGVNTPSG